MKQKIGLTDERRRIIERAHDEWLANGLSAEPGDFDSAENAITQLYAAIDRPRPYFVRLSSPLGAELYINLLTTTWPETFKSDQLRGQLGDQLRGQLGGQLGDQLWDQLGGQLGDQLWDQLRGQLRDQLWGQLGGQLRGQLRDQLWGQLWGQLGDQLRGQLGGQLGDQLWDQLGGQLGDQLWDQLRGQLRDQLWGQLGDQLWGQLWGQLGGQLRGQLRDQLWGQLWGQLWDQLRGQLSEEKLCFMGTWFSGNQEYLWPWLHTGRLLGAEYEARANRMLDFHIAVQRSIGWWYPFNDFCILTDRPEQIKLDDIGRLHCENGPALTYRDGWSMHAWHGRRVPAKWIEQKDTINPDEVLFAENVEQRATGLQIIGLARMKSHPAMKYRVIDGDPTSRLGALVEMSVPGLPRPGRFLEAVCPRNGTIIEGVPHVSDIDDLPIETAVAAQAWRIGDRQDEYQLSPRRT